MAKLSKANLKPNPFTTYRDPQTGRWLAIPSQKAAVRPAARSHPASECSEGVQY
ncbi:MAG: hypothetical protein SVX43_16895 [Cyanobacteriota bacterium]|nr:hypothetical protein [Cyanobacteriota bacterium]